MRHGPSLLKAALLVVCVAPLNPWSDPGWLLGVAHAQDPLWVIGDQAVHFPSGTATQITLAALPTPSVSSIPDDYEYQGQIAEHTQNAQYDDEGNLLFFIVDGNIYNRDGFLIADDAADVIDRDCEVCFLGGEEVHIIPVEGSCTRFFIVGLMFDSFEREIASETKGMLRWGVLDMALQSDLPVYEGQAVGVNGRFMSIGEREAAELFLSNPGGQWNPDFVEPENAPGDAISYLQDGTIRSSSAEDEEAIYGGSAQVDASGRALMVVRVSQALVILQFDATGIKKLVAPGLGADWPFDFESSVDVGDWDISQRGELTARITGDVLQVAHTSYNNMLLDQQVPPEPQIVHQTRVTYWRFSLDLLDPTIEVTADFSPQSEPDANPRSYSLDVYLQSDPDPLDFADNPITRPATCGVEFSPNGRYIYFVKSVPYAYPGTFSTESTFGYIDLEWIQGDPGTYYTYVPIGSTAFAGRLADTQLNLGDGIVGADNALYMLGATDVGEYWFGVFLDPDNPDPENWLVGNDFGSVVYKTDPTSPTTQYRVLPPRLIGGTHLQQMSSTACCSDMVSARDRSATITSTSDLSWEPGNNAFWNTEAPVHIATELRIQAGAVVNAHDMEFRFGDDAVLVIEEGAQLNCTDCIFTNACEGVRWKGIRVEGDASDHTQTGTHQGQLRLFTSTVEGALTGVWCTRESNNGGPGMAYGGGAVRAYGCSFRDCKVGARTDNYHRYAGNGAELPNLCYFAGCTFETTVGWGPTDVPKSHLIFSDVSGIKVMDCAFKNTTAVTGNLNVRGYGIFARDAGFTCNGTNPAIYKFEGLTAGVVASLPDPAKVYTVNGMSFKNNGQGLVDFGSSDATITNNQFVLRGSATTSNTATVGIQLFQSERYTVERNTFTDQGTNVPSVGIWFSGPAAEDNQIYDNTFTDLSVGTFVEGRQRADNGVPAFDPGLELLCGDHDGNNSDQLILQEGYIQFMQGLPINGNVTANNVFGPVDCDSNGPVDPSFNISVWAWDDYGMDVQYNYYDNATSPEMRPDCIEDEVGDPLSATGDWFYDLQFVTVTDPFDKEANCAGGVLDQVGGPGDVVQLSAQYKHKQGELRSAVGQYFSTIDREKTLDLLGMIYHQPWYPSYLLRDTLFAYYPLSDTALKSIIARAEPMDPWHLTQVFIHNSPLHKKYLDLIEESEILPPYFFAILSGLQEGQSAKAVLEQEVVLRQDEKTRLQHLLLGAWAADSTLAHRQDSLVAIFIADSLGDGLRGQYLTHLCCGEFTQAVALEAELDLHKFHKRLKTWGKIYQGVGGDWSQTDSTDRADLLYLAYNHAASAGALSWAVLLHIGELDSLPTPEIPAELKSLWMRRRHKVDAASTASALAVLPNPATDRIAFTYPAGMESGVLEMHDAQGRLVESIQLNGRKGLVESSVSGLSEGLYTVRLLLDGFNVANAKFNVMR